MRSTGFNRMGGDDLGTTPWSNRAHDIIAARMHLSGLWRCDTSRSHIAACASGHAVRSRTWRVAAGIRAVNAPDNRSVDGLERWRRPACPDPDEVFRRAQGCSLCGEEWMAGPGSRRPFPAGDKKPRLRGRRNGQRRL